MSVLALNDRILMQVEKPARYIGNEINSIIKDKNSVKVRMAMCFPDVYEIGMSHLGIQILYHMFNSYEDVWCERVYSPWPDLDRIMREQKIPLFALESQEPLKQLDFIGITLQYEMCYTNVLQILDLAMIPLCSKDRGEDDPIIIGGGPCSYNPEPIADFFDCFYIGEGETRYREFLDVYEDCKSKGMSRKEILLNLALVPGIYVPSLYQVTYHEDGTICSFEPIHPSVPKTVRKEVAVTLSDSFYPERPVVPFLKATQDRVTLEIQRGCIRGCRFCQAGQLYKPLRERNTETLEKVAVKMLENTGHDEICLSSLSSSDYSNLNELLTFLISYCNDRKINVSLPSLRIDAFSLDVMSKVQDIKKSSLTFAPEAGSQRMRNIINKGLTMETILEGARLAFEGGWSKVKLYFMLGLPFEQDEDVTAIGTLCNEIAKLYYETVPKEKRNGKVQITASTSFFIPKPFTAFQWAKMDTKEHFAEKAKMTLASIHSQLNQKSIRYMWHETDVSVLEGVFARGDRKVSVAIMNAYRDGCIFDAWSEYYNHEKWLSAFDTAGLSIPFYTTRERDEDEIFPWDFIDIGVSKQYLLREWNHAKKGKVTPNCKEACQGCGAGTYGNSKYCKTKDV